MELEDEYCDDFDNDKIVENELQKLLEQNIISNAEKPNIET